MSEGIVRLAEALDDQNMIGYTRSFVEDIENGLDIMKRNLLPWMNYVAETQWQGVLCLGMGGSGAGGDFISILCDHFGTLPVKTSRSYEIPVWWNKQHLIIATSHSGNTEETINAVENAARDGGTVIVISSGGVLAGLSELYEDVHLISSPGGQPPRTAFGHLFSRQLALLNQLDILPEMIDEAMISRLKSANEECDIINEPEGAIPSLALSLMDHQIALLGPDELNPALVRMKNQLNENSARFARIGVIPEMNHNEIVGWTNSNQNMIPVLIRIKDESEEIKNRFEALKNTVWKNTSIEEIFLKSQHNLSKIIEGIFIGDMVSIRLAKRNNIDPTPVKVIEKLKIALDGK